MSEVAMNLFEKFQAQYMYFTWHFGVGLEKKLEARELNK